MSKLSKYASRSGLMDIKIQLGEEVFTFNLYEELAITEARINAELLTQPSSYAFVGMLHKKLLRSIDDRKLEATKAWSRAYLWWKNEKNDYDKPYSDDYCRAQADIDKEYLDAVAAWNDLKEKASVLEICVRSFEDRKDLIQTISANNRKER